MHFIRPSSLNWTLSRDSQYFAMQYCLGSAGTSINLDLLQLDWQGRQGWNHLLSWSLESSMLNICCCCLLLYYIPTGLMLILRLWCWDYDVVAGVTSPAQSELLTTAGATSQTNLLWWLQAWLQYKLSIIQRSIRWKTKLLLSSDKVVSFYINVDPNFSWCSWVR